MRGKIDDAYRAFGSLINENRFQTVARYPQIRKICQRDNRDHGPNRDARLEAKKMFHYIYRFSFT